MCELYLSSPKMRSTPDYLISYLSRFLNFSSLGLYFVIERSYLRQSISSSEDQPEDDPSEDPDDDDYYFRGFFTTGFYFFCSGRGYFGSGCCCCCCWAFACEEANNAAAVAAFSFSIRSFSAANSISFRLIFSNLASALATLSFSSSSALSLSFGLSSLGFYCLGWGCAGVVGLGLAILFLSVFSKGLMTLGRYFFFESSLVLVLGRDWVGMGTGLGMGAGFLAFSNCAVTFQKCLFCLICSGVIVCSSFHFWTLFLVLSLLFSANRIYQWTSSSFFFFFSTGFANCTESRLERTSLGSSGLAGEDALNN